MKFLAILKDSWIQTLDCKSLYVMTSLSGVFVLMCASISYSPMDEQEAVKSLVEQFRTVASMRGMGLVGGTYEVTFRVDKFAALGSGAGQFEGGYEFLLTASPAAEWGRAVRHWDALKRHLVRKQEDRVPDLDLPPDAELQERCLRGRFREVLIPTVEVRSEPAEGDRRSFLVRIKPESREMFLGAYECRIGFGLTRFRMPMPVAMFVYLLEAVLSEWMAGLFGVLVALVVTGGFIPGMLQKGSLDVLLARPIGRPALLLCRYVGGLTYAVLAGGAFIGGSWLVLSARSGVWNWGYLATWGTLVFFFAILYSVGVLAAVATRSTIAAIFAPIAMWFLGSALNNAKRAVALPELAAYVPAAVAKALDVLHVVFPKPKDINDINSLLMARGSFGAAMEGAELPIPDIAWGMVLGSSFAFVALMLGLACWLFSRRDY